MNEPHERDSLVNRTSKTAWFWRIALIAFLVTGFFTHYPWPMIVAAGALLVIDGVMLLASVVKP